MILEVKKRMASRLPLNDSPLVFFFTQNPAKQELLTTLAYLICKASLTLEKFMEYNFNLNFSNTLSAIYLF